jgi:DNA-binding response OmpR family regulator
VGRRIVPVRILVVEDDDRVGDALSAALCRAGYAVARVSDGAAALAAVGRDEVDLVLLDLGLPDLDGLEVCRRLRAASGVPLIAVTARGAERDRVDGLRTGADDYVVKPFALAELLARIEAVLRRSRPGGPPAALGATIGDVNIDVDGRRVTVGGEPVELTRKEFDLLVLLIRRRGTVVGREEILRAVWETDWPGTGRTLDVHVASLRQKLHQPDLVRTVRGVGYIVDAIG